MKKIISLILSIALLATLMPTILVSAAEDEVLTLPITADTPLSYESDYMSSGCKNGEYNGGSVGSYLTRNISTAVTHGLHKVDLTGLSEKLVNNMVVEKVEFCVYTVPDLPNGATDGSYKQSNKYVSVYPVLPDWDENTITMSSWNGENNGVDFNTSAGTYTDDSFIANVTPATTLCSFPALAIDGTPYLTTLDITAAYNVAVENGMIENNNFSFLMVLPRGTGYGWVNFATREYANEAYHPYVKITLGDIPPATVVAESIPSHPDSDFSVTLDATIADAKVSVNGTSVTSGITTNDKAFTLDYPFAASTEYNVAVDLTDVNGSKHTQTYTFTTNDGTDTSSEIKIYVNEDTYLTNRNDQGKGWGGDVHGPDSTMRFGDSAVAAAYGMYPIVKVPLGDIVIPDGKAISKAEVHFSRLYNSSVHNSSQSCKFNFYNTTSAWDENSTSLLTWRSAGYSPSIADDTINATPSAIVSYKTPVVSASQISGSMDFDITPTFKEAFPTGEFTESSVWSFVSEFDYGNSYQLFEIASSENEDKSLRPYITLTLEDIPELAVTSEAIPDKPSDVFSLTMSNPIKEAVITVNDQNVDAIVSENTLSFDYEYEPISKYDVAVNITDIYNNNFEEEYSFTTSYVTTTTETLVSSAHHLKPDGTSSVVSGVGSSIAPSAGVIIYKAYLPTIASNSYLDKFEFSFWDKPGGEDMAKYLKVYECSLDAAIDPATLKLEDISYCLTDENIVSDVYLHGTAAWYENDPANIAAYTANNYRVDATAYANKCISAGKTEIYFIVYCDYTKQLLGANANMDSGYTKAFKTTVYSSVNTDPSITVANTDFAFSGATVKKANVKLLTRFNAGVEDNMHLYDEKGIEVENVPFAYNSFNGEIYLSQPFALKENAKYTLKLEGELEDIYDNKKTLDIEIASFTTGVDFVNHGIKLFEKDTEVEKDAFATTDGLTSAAVGTNIQGYWRADNNGMKKALIIAIGAYDDNNELLGVQFSAFDANDEETKIYKTNALTVPTGATKIKAFGWDGTSQAGIAFAEIPVQ